MSAKYLHREIRYIYKYILKVLIIETGLGYLLNSMKDLAKKYAEHTERFGENQLYVKICLFVKFPCLLLATVGNCVFLFQRLL